MSDVRSGIILFMIMLLVNGCVARIPPPSPAPLEILKPVKLTDAQVKIIKKSVSDQLKDPESARFGKIVAGTSASRNASITVCGIVNAKNGFGGYAGKKPFLGLLMIRESKAIGFNVISMGGDESNISARETVCSNQGLNLED